MDRAFYLDLAKRGLRMPIGTHLVLHEHADAAEIPRDGERLGDVVIETAERFETPLAFPLMDLTLEKRALLRALGVPDEEIDSHHFNAPPTCAPEFRMGRRMRAACDAITHVSARRDLLPMGMEIGPFSLTTKLVNDPITPVFLAGSGMGADDEEEIATLEAVLAVATDFVLAYCDAQIDAGAKAIVICEPAANTVYFSPNQLRESYAVFDRYVMDPMRRIRARLDERGADLVFHDCGELDAGMVERFATLDAAIMSLGGSRCLWEDAARVPDSTVLYGNLPSKNFVSSTLTVAEVERLSGELLERMDACGHPFILGSECDSLHVPGSEGETLAKIDAFMKLPSPSTPTLTP